jgi:tetratricopeptide (TPR) repeat protein
LKAFTLAKQGGPDSYYVDEAKINRLGYQLMNRGKTAEAIEVFKLNVQEFPRSSNTYDSLGEGYAKAGSKDLAIHNYKRSLELDPNNRNAEDWIKRLNAGETRIDPNTFDDYVGKYDSPMGPIIISRDGDKLFGAPQGESKIELVPKATGKFEIPSLSIQVEFVRDGQGRVIKMLIVQGGQPMEAKRVGER